MAKPLQKEKLLKGDIMSHRKSPRFTVSLKRFNAEVTEILTEKVIPSRVFLVDISEDGAGLFTLEPIAPGTMVAVCLRSKSNKHVIVNGQTIWCSKIQENSKIISKQKYPYRVGVQFHKLTSRAQEILKDFLSNALNG